MSQKAVHLFLIIIFLALVGCSKATEEEVNTNNNEEDTSNFFYENSEWGIYIATADGWHIEKETAKNAQFNSEKLVAIISVIPKANKVSEIKKQLLAGAGEVTVIGEGLNFISWKTNRQESIRTQVWVEEKPDRYVIVTVLTPNETYEANLDKIETFRENIKFY